MNRRSLFRLLLGSPFTLIPKLQPDPPILINFYQEEAEMIKHYSYYFEWAANQPTSWETYCNYMEVYLSGMANRHKKLVEDLKKLSPIV